MHPKLLEVDWLWPAPASKNPLARTRVSAHFSRPCINPPYCGRAIDRHRGPVGEACLANEAKKKYRRVNFSGFLFAGSTKALEIYLLEHEDPGLLGIRYDGQNFCSTVDDHDV